MGGFLIGGCRRAKKIFFAPSAQNESSMMNPRVSLMQGFLISGGFFISGCHAENRKRVSYKWGFLMQRGFF